MRAHVDHDRRRAAACSRSTTRGATARRRERAWDAAGDAVADCAARAGGTVAFATIGDPNVYSTFTYLAADRPRSCVPDVAGRDRARHHRDAGPRGAQRGAAACEGREPLTLLPLTAGIDAAREALTRGRHRRRLQGRPAPAGGASPCCEEHGRLDGAVFGAAPGAARTSRVVDAARRGTTEAPYLSTRAASRPRAHRREAAKL